MEIQARIDDPHVVKITEWFVLSSAKKMVIIMEFCSGGNLLEWIKRCRRHKLLNETFILKVFREICTAVYSCHQLKVMHRDIKPENILMDHNRKIKLGGWVGIIGILYDYCLFSIIGIFVGWLFVYLLLLGYLLFVVADFGVARVLHNKSVAQSFCGKCR